LVGFGRSLVGIEVPQCAISTGTIA
jgi:hypothetical protein